MSQKGFTIIESLLSLLLLLIMMTGGMAFYFRSNQYAQPSIHKRMATEQASALMEEIRRAGYIALPAPAPGGLHNTTVVPLGGLSANKSVYVYEFDEDSDSWIDYKQVTVEINWSDPNKPVVQQVTLNTYISS